MSLERMCLHSRMEFQTWLANDLEVREELDAMLGEELGLDAESLDKLEAFLLGRYRDPDDALKLSERGILDAAARHFGLVLLLNVDGSKWDIDLENEDNVYYRLPVIVFSDGAVMCPVTMSTTALDRRTGVFLRARLERSQKEYNSPTED